MDKDEEKKNVEAGDIFEAVARPGETCGRLHSVFVNLQ